MTWASFLDQLTRLIDGEDTSSSLGATLLQIVALGERRVYRELRTRWNEKAFSGVTVTGNLAPIPSDYESPSIIHFGAAPLEPVSEHFVLQQSLNPRVRYFAQAGANLTFAGVVSDGETVQGRYFCRLPNLGPTTTATNDFLNAETSLFTYAALSESAPFYGQDARLPIWEAKYTAIKDSLNEAHLRAAYSSGRLRMRPSARIERLPLYSLSGSSTAVSSSVYADNYADAYA